MNTTEQNQAREKYFDQLTNIYDDWFTIESIHEEDGIKERILSITYDTNAALQKRVEELEAAISEVIGFWDIDANERIQNKKDDLICLCPELNALIVRSQKLLTKQS